MLGGSACQSPPLTQTHDVFHNEEEKEVEEERREEEKEVEEEEVE